MQIAVIGHGRVGGALARGLAAAGHTVTIGARDPGAAEVIALQTAVPGLRVAAPAAAVAGAEALVLAVPFEAAAGVLAPLRADLAGKILIDCTNPVGPGLTHGLGSTQSGTAALAAVVPEARAVKAFSVYGYENLADPPAPVDGVRPAMFFCGDDAGAKAAVGGLITDLGFAPLDVGGLVQALHLEHMTLLWVRMVRAGRRSPRLVWAALGG